jgi:hypothetical protein
LLKDSIERKSKKYISKEKFQIAFAVMNYDAMWPQDIKRKYLRDLNSNKLLEKFIRYLTDSIGSQGQMVPEKIQIVIEVLKL